MSARNPSQFGPVPVDPADYTAAQLGGPWLTADEAAALIVAENPPVAVA